MRGNLELFYDHSDEVCFKVDANSQRAEGMHFLFALHRFDNNFEEMYLSTAEAEALYYFLEKNLNLKLDND